MSSLLSLLFISPSRTAGPSDISLVFDGGQCKRKLAWKVTKKLKHWCNWNILCANICDSHGKQKILFSHSCLSFFIPLPLPSVFLFSLFLTCGQQCLCSSDHSSPSLTASCQSDTWLLPKPTHTHRGTAPAYLHRRQMHTYIHGCTESNLI